MAVADVLAIYEVEDTNPRRDPVIVSERWPPELEGTNVNWTEDLLGRGICIALVKPNSFGVLKSNLQSHHRSCG